MIKQGYSEPKLHECGGDISKEWYVDLRFTCPQCQVRMPYQYRMGINFLKTVVERRAEGKAVASLLKKALKAGWNPHHEAVDVFLRRQLDEQVSLAKDPGMMPFNKALDYALESKRPNLADKSYRCFKTGKVYAQRAAIKLGYFDMPVKETKRAHIKELMNQILRDRQAEYDKEGKGRKVSGNFYNKYKSYLLCIFSELEQFDAIEYNPCTRIKDRPQIRTNIHRHATAKERQLIKSTLQLKYPEFYYYVLMEHMTGIRPKEIFYIRICDIDWFNQSFNLEPYEEGTKTREARKVPIPDALMKYLKAMHLERFPVTHYLFSTGFRPGPERKKRDFATKTWHEYIKVGLGLKVSLYSFKGLGGEDRRSAGISLAAVSSQYGHSNLRTTMVYTYNEQERMNKEIREKTPEL